MPTRLCFMDIADVPDRTKPLFLQVVEDQTTEPALGVWSGYDNNTGSLVILLTQTTLEIVGANRRRVWSLDEVDQLAIDVRKLTIQPGGRRQRLARVVLDTDKSVAELVAAYPRDNLKVLTQRVPEAAVVAALPSIPGRMMTTLPGLPGYEIVAVHGIVSELTSSAGWTASSKGNFALAEALGRIRVSAVLVGANAIVGMSATTFGAHGGITNMVGGDAVGVLLMGTAVTAAKQSGSDAEDTAPPDS
jgi:uncharacterized protein YbjQ (UPF0145 family)